ncbi:hypothetical protein O181_103828 [Austropuccinia psidii MF-1]|uniref:Integrase catalytic domain-containing protein n=1 Tax=Austropuccinia psidii MF-1 TaxID=1389203 RepID=A0A9Q3JJ05_9BASI|nr:hypothetical protein [Austropuccinia psidii MF-1]
MEYKDHEGYTHDWVTPLPEVQQAYNTSQHSTTGKTPAVIEKGWNPLLSMDHLKKNLLTIHPTANISMKCGRELVTHLPNAYLKKNIIISRGGTDDIWKCSLRKGTKLEVKLTEEFSRKHPVFPVNLVKPYFQTEEDKFPSRKKDPTPQERVEVGDSPGTVKKTIKARRIGLNGKDKRQYLVGFKSQKADKDKWLAEDVIPNGNLHLRRFRSSTRTEKS